MGLIMNGFVKVPMQFLILLIGVLVFSFYLFNKAPVFFNEVQVKKLERSSYKDSFLLARQQYDAIALQKQQVVSSLVNAMDNGESSAIDNTTHELRHLQLQSDTVRNKVKAWINSKEVKGDGNDTNYIFLRFVVDYLPSGLVGLLIAIIFLACCGSIAAATNSLASCSMVDFHTPLTQKN